MALSLQSRAAVKSYRGIQGILNRKGEAALPRLEGEKSNAGVWIVGLVLLIVVATVLYFVFARPAGNAPSAGNGATAPAAGADTPAQSTPP
jgi:hypothetical protein